MAGLSHSQLESRYYNAAYARLRTFDKTVNVAATVYLGSSGTSGYAAGTGYGNTRFEYVNAGQGTYSTGDIPNRIGDNSLVVASDIQNFATNCISRTVNQIEGRITNRSFNFRICHSSCHYSCHGSRGRR
jgi:hypothetical protein